MESTPLSGKLTSLTGRYAKTLFELATENDDVSKIAVQFSDLCDLIKSKPDLMAVISSPALSRQEHELVFSELSKKLDLNKILISFIAILAENRRLDKLFEVQTRFQELINSMKNLTQVDVISAHALNKGQQKEIITILSNRFGGDVDITYSTDPAKLGGILVRIGNQTIDLTLANQLNHLAHAMKGRA